MTGSLRGGWFSFSVYAPQPFGMFQEEPVDVVLRFALGVAEDAVACEFCPSPSTEWESDGALVVRFRLAGTREMCWHFFT